MSTEMYLPPASDPPLRSIPHTPTIGKVLYFRSTSAFPPYLLEVARAEQVQQPDISSWCGSTAKRIFDLMCVLPALILLSPLLITIAIAIRFSSPGPVIFRQQRAGRHRRLFTIYKFRTMVVNSETLGPEHTAKGDPRITSIGRFLRRWKLDELPQLYNVLAGNMSLVGPRPKLPNHDHSFLVCRPGVTGAATLAFRREQHLLSEIPADRLEAFYQEYIVPRKAKLDGDYMRRATLATDIHVLLATVLPARKSLTLQDLFLFAGRSAESDCSKAPIAFESN